jgi:hypothetical protein
MEPRKHVILPIIRGRFSTTLMRLQISGRPHATGAAAKGGMGSCARDSFGASTGQHMQRLWAFATSSDHAKASDASDNSMLATSQRLARRTDGFMKCSSRSKKANSSLIAVRGRRPFPFGLALDSRNRSAVCVNIQIRNAVGLSPPTRGYSPIAQISRAEPGQGQRGRRMTRGCDM